MKISVVYHSETGNTAKMADCIVQGLLSVEGIEAKAFSLDNVDKDFAKASQALILGTPVYGGSFSGKIKMWMETELGGLQAGGKLAGAFATANFIHGGADVAIQAILAHFMVHGMLIYSSGVAKGQPFIHFGPVAIGSDLPSFEELFKIYGQRMAEKAKELF
ncbi:flavodoxin [Deltaproteobacteria bacterium Smac51]|nr:flavodoxin [Deltaproteobacteria bacterium Smac51]